MLIFEKFDIISRTDSSGNCWDYVEINDGSSIQRYCDTYYYPGPGPGPFFSTGTNITFKFHTSSAYNANGFMAAICCSVNVTTDVIGKQEYRLCCNSPFNTTNTG